jgi:hypothetical protein
MGRRRQGKSNQKTCSSIDNLMGNEENKYPVPDLK